MSATSVNTSMGDDFLVRFNAFHIDAVLLFPDDDSPPEFGVLSLLLRAVCRNRFCLLLHWSSLGFLRL